MSNPIDQFRLHKIIELNVFGFDISITNSVLMMFAVLGALIIVLTLLTGRLTLLPGKAQAVAEAFYNFVFNLVTTNIKENGGLKFFPLIFTVFMFIFFSNAMGVIPYSFTITSHVSVTLSIATAIFVLMVVVGFYKKGVVGFFTHFVPSGIPIFLAPLMFVIEFFTYLVRPLTLALRLAINMVAGHTILKVIAGFVGMMGVFGVIPIAFIAVLTGFELFVAGLQAYIFSILSCIYLNEALAEHH